VSNGVWTGLPSSFAYEWRQCDAADANCVPVPGATGPDYTLLPVDVGSTLVAVVTARNAFGTAVAFTAPSAPVLSATAASPPGGFSAVVLDTTCRGCEVVAAPPTGLRATVPGEGQSHSAFGVVGLGPAVAGTLYVRDLISLVSVFPAAGDIRVLQARDAAGGVVFELVIGTDRILRLWSPAGGLAAHDLSVSTGIAVPADGHAIRVEVGLRAGGPVVVRVDGIERALIAKLVGGLAAEPVLLRVGVLDYAAADGPAGGSLAVEHDAVAASGAGWLGAPGVADPPPSSTAPPAIAGSPAIGAVLTAIDGSWSDSLAMLSYQWLRCDLSGASCAPIVGATANSYTVTRADAGSTIGLAVTATNTSGAATAMATPGSLVVLPPPSSTAPPAITGHPAVGSLLVSIGGAWSDAASVSSQWQRCDATRACADIAGETGSAYSPTAADVGSSLRVVVTAAGAGGITTALSAPTAPVSMPDSQHTEDGSASPPGSGTSLPSESGPDSPASGSNAPSHGGSN